MACLHPTEARNVERVEVGRYTDYVTRDMALDAGDPAMEGTELDGGPIYEPMEICTACGAVLE